MVLLCDVFNYWVVFVDMKGVLFLVDDKLFDFVCVLVKQLKFDEGIVVLKLLVVVVVECVQVWQDWQMWFDEVVLLQVIVKDLIVLVLLSDVQQCVKVESDVGCYVEVLVILVELWLQFVLQVFDVVVVGYIKLFVWLEVCVVVVVKCSMGLLVVIGLVLEVWLDVVCKLVIIDFVGVGKLLKDLELVFQECE